MGSGLRFSLFVLSGKAGRRERGSQPAGAVGGDGVDAGLMQPFRPGRLVDETREDPGSVPDGPAPKTSSKN